MIFVSWHTEVSGGLIVWSFALAWLTVRTGGLEAAIALHVVGNLAFYLPAVAFGVSDFSPENEVWGGLDLNIFCYLPMIWFLARRKRITRWAPEVVART